MLSTLIALLAVCAALWAIFRALRPSERDRTTWRRLERAQAQRLSHDDRLAGHRRRNDYVESDRSDHPHS